MAKTVAAINDDTTFLTLLEELLTDEGYQVRAFREGVSDYEERWPDLAAHAYNQDPAHTGTRGARG